MGSYASCIDCGIMLCWSYLVSVVVVHGCSCMLLLHPVLASPGGGPDCCTLCPELAPCTLTFARSACAVSLLSTGANITLAQVVVVTSYVVTCAGEAFSFSHYSADSPLAHVVVSPSTACAGGAFSSSHWRKYCAGTRATCTVWWWLVLVNCCWLVVVVVVGEGWWWLIVGGGCCCW